MKFKQNIMVVLPIALSLLLVSCSSGEATVSKTSPQNTIVKESKQPVKSSPETPQPTDSTENNVNYTSDAANQNVKAILMELQEKVQIGMNVDDIVNELKQKYAFVQFEDFSGESFGRGYGFIVGPTQKEIGFKVGQKYSDLDHPSGIITKVDGNKIWTKDSKEPVDAYSAIINEMSKFNYHMFFESKAQVVLSIFTPQSPDKGWENKIAGIHFTYRYGNDRYVHHLFLTRYATQLELEAFKY